MGNENKRERAHNEIEQIAEEISDISQWLEAETHGCSHGRKPTTN